MYIKSQVLKSALTILLLHRVLLAMKSVVVVVLALLQSVVGSQPAPYVSFKGQTLANHSYVDLSQVGTSDSDSVQCIADRHTCCRSTDGSHRGDWYFPDGAKVKFTTDIYVKRFTKRVDLFRRNSALSPTGIYHCDIPTNAVHDATDNSVRDTVYVGLYSGDRGIYLHFNHDDPLIMLSLIGIISGLPEMKFSEVSDLNGASPRFTLTCISTGGPATTVTWTRDSTTVAEGTETVLNDPMTAKYTHTLTVTGRYPGLYYCTVANNKPSQASANYTVKGKLKKNCVLLATHCFLQSLRLRM